jgi:transaldolase/glucose-6-phosphate isomerase
VPGTEEGIKAFGKLIRTGVNINVTLLFSVNSYRRVAETYIDALEARVATGADISRLASVASFFVSRIDSAADAQLESRGASQLAGKTAIANAKVAYAVYQQLFSGERWNKLAAKGAQVQRVLWASTGTKNKKYSDVLYIEELIGPDTVNTVPPATLKAFQAHGKVRNSLQENLAGAQADLKALAAAGVSLDDITAHLLTDGLQSFTDSFNKLLAAIEARKA